MDLELTFLELKKNLKKDFSGFKKVRVGLLGDFATQHLNQAIRGYGYEVAIDFDLFEADYDQIDRQILCRESELYIGKPEYVLILHSVQKFLRKFYATDIGLRAQFAQNEIDKIRELVDELGRNIPNVKIILGNFTEWNDSVFGQYANKTDVSFLYQIRRINFDLMNLASVMKNVYICDIAAMAAAFGHAKVVDNRNYIEASMAFGLDFLPRLAKGAVDIIQAVSGAQKKCLILDLDNTLWGGVIGDDGIENIQIGDLQQGKAFSELQRWAKELKNRGVILAICSKNEEIVAKAPFETHPEMVLRLDDISIFLANWDSKVENIKKIKSFLNIGYDAMVFVDDHPYERGVVKHLLPDVTVPNLPEDPADYLPFLIGLNLFETASYTDDDRDRTTYFQQELKRDVAQSQFSSESDFLANLGMTCRIDGFSPFNIPRAAQLIQRSNQFNLRTVRYSEEDLLKISLSKSHIGYAFSVNDRFGAYGLISLVILLIQDDELFIDSWVMSCRVLKRGVEHLVLNTIVQKAKDLGVKRIRGEYIETQKNGLVKDHYSSLGFVNLAGGMWTLEVADYIPHRHHLGELSAAQDGA